MFDRLARGFALAKSSWNVLYTDKKLVVFPIISGIAVLLIMATFLGPLVVLALNGTIRFDTDPEKVNMPLWGYPLLFAFYFCTWFVVLFCNAALISCALKRFNGEEPTVADGISAAASRLPQILAWALVSASVGLLLKLIENVHEKVGEIVSALLGTAWSIVTFFVVPVLVVEQVGPIQAITRSVEILKKTWGEALVGNLGLGLFKFLLFLPGILIILGGVALCVVVHPGPGLAVVGLGFLYLLLCGAVSSALDTIFLAALYRYAAFNSVPAGFDRANIEQAFTTKKKTG